MNKTIGKIRLLAANLVWFLSCIPSYISFNISIWLVRYTQERILQKILNLVKSTRFGKDKRMNQITSSNKFNNIKIRNYEDFKPYINYIINGEQKILSNDPINLLVPTSGSTSSSKLIPYTNSLKKEFQSAINPWIASLYINYPSLFFGKFYWAISPNTRPSNYQEENSPPIGFENDIEYLNPVQKWISKLLFPIPSDVRLILNQRTWKYCTLLFLLGNSNLRLISVWHPSYLIILMESIKSNLPSLIEDIRNGSINQTYKFENDLYNKLLKSIKPNPDRAVYLSELDISSVKFIEDIWPNLRVISCWADGQAQNTIPKLQKMFPNVVIQPKGLVATEGIISIPFGKRNRNIAAVRSHFYEFIDKTDNSIKRLWELQDNKRYNVVLTTGGGLYRYLLNDIVKVDGFLGNTPCLAFISRDGIISDYVGEKLNSYHVADIVMNLENKMAISYEFIMIAPVIRNDKIGYALFIKQINSIKYNYKKISKYVEQKLCENYHYLHARKISQLAELCVFLISSNNTNQIYIDYYIKSGIKRGDIKFAILEKTSGWENIFRGKFIYS